MRSLANPLGIPHLFQLSLFSIYKTVVCPGGWEEGFLESHGKGTRSPSSALSHPFFGEGCPTKIDKTPKKNGTNLFEPLYWRTTGLIPWLLSLLFGLVPLLVWPKAVDMEASPTKQEPQAKRGHGGDLVRPLPLGPSRHLCSPGAALVFVRRSQRENRENTGKLVGWC